MRRTIDSGNADNCTGFFKPDTELSVGIHTFNVLFTYFGGGKETVKVTYDTRTAKDTADEKADEQDASDTAEKADELDGSKTNDKTGKKQDTAHDSVATNKKPGANTIEKQETIGTQPNVPRQNKNTCDRPPRKFTMSGKIVDANTGRGIYGAKFVVLVPGTLIYEYDAFLDSSSILSQAVTDRLGKYTLSRRLRNGRKYSMFISAVGYKRYKLDEQLMESCGKSLTNNFKLRPFHY